MRPSEVLKEEIKSVKSKRKEKTKEKGLQKPAEKQGSRDDNKGGGNKGNEKKKRGPDEDRDGIKKDKEKGKNTKNEKASKTYQQSLSTKELSSFSSPSSAASSVTSVVDGKKKKQQMVPQEKYNSRNTESRISIKVRVPAIVTRLMEQSHQKWRHERRNEERTLLHHLLRIFRSHDEYKGFVSSNSRFGLP